MKNIFCIGLISFFISTNIYTQAPFGTLGTKWTFEGWTEGSGWQPNWEGGCPGNELLFEVTNEIVIDGKTCGIITTNKSNDSLIVYQESGIVYFYENSNFYKLYDFTASKGDTILTFRPSNAGSFSLKDFFGEPVETYTSIDTIYTIINDFDTTVINGVELKRWKTSALLTDDLEPGPVRLFETIIENIGSLNGIIGDHDFFIGDGCYGGFVCYESDQYTFGSYFFPKCEFTSSNTHVSTSKLKILPNPVQNSVSIQLESENIKRVQIFDITGIRIISTSEKTIDVSTIPKGVYIILVIDNHNNIYTEKIIKQ